MPQGNQACEPQLLKPEYPELMLCNKSSHGNEKNLSTTPREKGRTATETQSSKKEGKKRKKRPKVPTTGQITEHLRGTHAGQARTGQAAQQENAIGNTAHRR